MIEQYSFTNVTIDYSLKLIGCKYTFLSLYLINFYSPVYNLVFQLPDGTLNNHPLVCEWFSHGRFITSYTEKMYPSKDYSWKFSGKISHPIIIQFSFVSVVSSLVAWSYFPATHSSFSISCSLFTYNRISFSECRNALSLIGHGVDVPYFYINKKILKWKQ